MLQISIEVDKLAWPTEADTKKALQSAVKICTAYMRRRIDARFKAEGPDWPPRKAQDDAVAAVRASRASSLAEHRLRRKLERDLRRATRNLDRARKAGKDTTKQAASMDRRYAVLKEYERQARGGRTDIAYEDKGDKRLSKSVAGLRERKARAQAAVAGKLLGDLANSIKTNVKGLEGEVKSPVPFSGVQNEGGRVGKGATLPARPAFYVTSEDATVMQEITVNRLAALYGAD